MDIKKQIKNVGDGDRIYRKRWKFLECIEIVDSPSKKKYYIPKHIKEQVWSRYIGDDKNESLCHSCQNRRCQRRHFVVEELSPTRMEELSP